MATPHIATKQKLSDLSSLGTGAVMRILVPAVLLVLLNHFEVMERTLGPLWPFDNLVIMGAIGLATITALILFFHRLISGSRELERRILLSSGPCLGGAAVLSVNLESDEVLIELRRVDKSAALARRAVAQYSRYERILHRMMEMPPVGKRLRRSSWLREWGLFTVFGASLILVGAMMLWYNVFNLDEETKSVLRPWVFPASNFASLKFLIYALVLGAAYAGAAIVLGQRRLPAWHRAAFRVGHYLAMLSRLSQLHSFKAGLLGLPGLALHAHDASVQLAPMGGKSYSIVSDVPNPHSAILELTETLVAIRGLAARAVRSKDPAADVVSSAAPAVAPKETLGMRWHVVTTIQFGLLTLGCLFAAVWITYFEAPAMCSGNDLWCLFLQGIVEIRDVFQIGFGAVALCGLMCTAFFWMTRPPRKSDVVKVVNPSTADSK